MWTVFYGRKLTLVKMVHILKNVRDNKCSIAYDSK